MPSLYRKLFPQLDLSLVELGGLGLDELEVLRGVNQCVPNVFVVSLDEELQAPGSVRFLRFLSPLLEFVDFGDLVIESIGFALLDLI